MPFVMDILTDEDRIVAACHDPNRELVHDPDAQHTGVRCEGVIRYTSKTVVKFGVSVEPHEPRTQQLAHSILDPRVVRVPEVYHYFQRDTYGYLVMEYIEGKIWDSHATPEQFQKIADAIHHLASHHLTNHDGGVPGPVGGGWTRGLPYDMEAVVEHEDIEDLNDYWNERLHHKDGRLWDDEFCENPVARFDWKQSDLVLTHCDIVPYNIIWCADVTPALLDWVQAGFFPRTFEHEALSNNWTAVHDGSHKNWSTEASEYFIASLQKLLPLSKDEQLEKEKIARAVNNTFRFRIFTDNPNPSRMWLRGGG